MTDVQTIKDKIDVVDLISEYVQLKPAGSNHKGLCPFHHEKSPSFMAHRDRQFWHCFGCGKGGDIFTFVQEIEGMEFVEALKYLAQKAGIPLETIASETNTSQKNRIKDINTTAARFYHHVLTQLPAAEPAREYLNKRGLKQETIDEWQIGFIPEQWDLLTKYLLKKGCSIDDLVASGLTIAKDGARPGSQSGFYDRFRGRVMFPIWDVHGGVVGFTGRILVEKENSGGKYVNTPQTLVYDKSRVIFGLNKAKQEIKAKDLVVMVEGQMDVVACHQAGMKNVVAASGTAMTEEQVKLLKRYSHNVAIAFDADAAGQNAAERGIEVALAEGLHINVITIPDGAGKDADECLKKNPDVWFQSVTNARDIMSYYFDKAFAGKSVNRPQEKQQAADRLLPKIARIPFAVERDHWLRELGALLSVDVSVLREDIERLKKQNPERKLVQGAPITPPVKKELPLSRHDILAERLFSLLLKFPFIIPDVLTHLPIEVLSTSRPGHLYETLKRMYTQASSFGVDTIRHALIDPTHVQYLDILQLKAEKDFSDFLEDKVKHESQVLIRTIKEEWIKGRRTAVQQAISVAEKSGNHEELKRLMQEYQNIAL